MAKRKSAKRSAERGGTLYGVLTGLLIGLIVAAAVAFYVTRAPVPFVDRASRHASQSALPDVANSPDPNSGLYGRDGAAGVAPTGPTATKPAPVPDTQTATPQSPSGSQTPDDLGALIASLPATTEPQARSADKPAEKVTEKTADKASEKVSERASDKATDKSSEKATQKGTKPSAPTAVASASPSGRDSAKPANGNSNSKYFLQAGAYRAAEDADALRARILLLGLPVAVQRAEVNGKSINRVRVGPFARLDDMNRARTQLGENKIEVAVVRQ